MPEQIRMDFAAQEAAMGQVKSTIDQMTQHLQQMKQLHSGNLQVWHAGGNEAYGTMTATHQAALNAAGEFTGKMHSAMSNSLMDYQGAVSQATSGLNATPVPPAIA